MIKTSLLQELDLIIGCQQNSYKAQMQVYERYQNMLYNASWRVLKNDFDAQDVVHDTFIKAFKNIEQLKGDNNLGAWLKRIAINRSLDIVKSKAKVRWVEEIDTMYFEDDIQIETPKHFTVGKVQECLNELSEKYRLVLVLYLFDNYSHKEISEFLKINESTVRNQYARGKRQLQEVMKSKLEL